MKDHLVLAFLMVAACCLPSMAQGEMASSPVVWERFGSRERGVAFLFPKLPVRISRSDVCREREGDSYYAFADGAVYEVTITAKSRQKIPQWCGSAKRFDANVFAGRLAEIRSGKDAGDETTDTIDDRQVFKFESDTVRRWVVSDMKNNRWAELAVYKRKDGKSNEDFFTSIDFDSTRGKEIGDGAELTLGDPKNGPEPVVKDPATAAVTDPLRVIAKPKAVYTAAARQHGLQGTVRLRVVLQANGSVGSITKLSELGDGLTEQAIAAAKRLVFLPTLVNGVAVSKTMTVEYRFSLY